MTHSSSKYIPVEIQRFRNASKEIRFDVFLRVADGNFAHVFSKATGLDYKRLADYIQKGLKELYVSEEDRPLLEEYLKQNDAETFLSDPSITNERKVAAVANLTEQALTEIFTQVEVSEETAKNTERVIKSYVTLMARNPKSLTTLLKLAAHGQYLYYHAIAVSVFSLYLAKASGQFNQRMIEMIGLGGLLHDIGCTQLPKDMLDSPDELSPEQWNDMRAHTKLGLKMLEATANIPDEVRFIIYQHHEEPGGTGYPNGLRDGTLFYPAKIVAVADAFSALISRRPYRAAYTFEQALQILQSAGKHDPSIVDLLVAIFARRTPSSEDAA